MTMNANEGILLKSFEGDYALSCKEIHERFKEYAVKTTHVEIKEIVDKALTEPRGKQIYMFRSIFHELIKYSDDELNTHYNNKDQEWQDWCNDVALFYVYRLVLLDKMIPIFKLRNQ